MPLQRRGLEIEMGLGSWPLIMMHSPAVVPGAPVFSGGIVVSSFPTVILRERIRNT